MHSAIQHRKQLTNRFSLNKLPDLITPHTTQEIENTTTLVQITHFPRESDLTNLVEYLPNHMTTSP